ncbi:hypothetical protein M9Y10_024150 [Tritrichomonas musculus]|uniref:Uncharacterized protein n=1 Tax=Tritrichomonas musculus TaxID=1915356 RepID=A0ABR2KX64_9EUKA
MKIQSGDRQFSILSHPTKSTPLLSKVAIVSFELHWQRMRVLIHQIPKGLPTSTFSKKLGHSVVGEDRGMPRLERHHLHSLESKSYLLSLFYQRALNQNEVNFNKENSFAFGSADKY